MLEEKTLREIHIINEKVLGKRARISGVAYLFLFSIIYFCTPLQNDRPAAINPLAVSLLIIAVLRMWLSTRQDSFYPGRRGTWNHLFNVSAVLAAVIFGFLGLLSIRSYNLNHESLITLLTVCGVSAGAASSLYYRKWLANFYVIVAILPGLIMETILGTREGYGAAGVSAAYLSFLLVQITQSKNTHWDSLVTKQLVVEEKNKLEETQKQLTESEARLKRVLTASHIGIWEENFLAGSFKGSANFGLVYGLEFHPQHRNEISKIVSSQDLKALQERDEQIRNAKEGFWQEGSWVEFRVVCRDSVKWIAEIVHPVFNGSGQVIGCSGVAMDISQRKEHERVIEEQKVKMLSTAKFAALGEMAGGLAHQVNNPLAIVSGATEMLQAALKQTEPPKEKVDYAVNTIQTTVARIAKTIKSLKTFSRSAVNDPFEETRVQDILDDTLALCQVRLEKHNVNLIVECESKDLKITCRKVEVSQALLNLLNNAYDAVVRVPEKWIKIQITDSDEFVQLGVIDSGPGISPELRDKVMQPFFTTKEVGNGAGLGLSVSKGIVESHKGKLFLDTTSDHTRFVMSLSKNPTRSRLKGAA